MAVNSSQPHEFSWQDCEDFQVPENSVWFGKDDDGSDIFCGKAWCEGQEVPAKIIPERKECRVNCNGSERVVPRCRKVLICRGSSDSCDRRRDHCHRRRHHCHRRDDCSSDSENEEETTSTTTTSSSKNESRLLIRSIKCSSTSSTTVVKKNKKEHKKRKDHHNQCWDERRTRMIPKVTVQPRVRYIPKVTMERTVRYEPETYVAKVCCDDRCDDRCERRDSCDSCDSYEPCEEPCRQKSKCKEAIVCENSSSKKRDRCVRPKKCDPPSPQPKAKCW